MNGMKKIYYLSTCSTCKRVIHDLKLNSEFEFQDVKTEPITELQLDLLKELAGSYEKIFSKIAMKYRIWGLHERKLTEAEYKDYILKEYTFIKRPVIVIDSNIFIGSSRPVINEAKKILNLVQV
jgi:arsenate reductase (glutaredoxin)